MCRLWRDEEEAWEDLRKTRVLVRKIVRARSRKRLVARKNGRPWWDCPGIGKGAAEPESRGGALEAALAPPRRPGYFHDGGDLLGRDGDAAIV